MHFKIKTNMNPQHGHIKPCTMPEHAAANRHPITAFPCSSECLDKIRVNNQSGRRHEVDETAFERVFEFVRIMHEREPAKMEIYELEIRG